MVKRALIFLFFLSVLIPFRISAQIASVDNVCLDEQEIKLVNLINQLRVQNNLPIIALSRSLSFVAKLHVYDLQLNKQDTSICNAHSWSDKGKWTSCCYNSYVLKNNCMWDKPKELTSYNFRGYELVYNEEGIVSADSVFKLWKSSEEVLDMLLSRASHSDKKWLAIGIGVSENYVSVWFGQRLDPTPKPAGCFELKNDALQSTADQPINMTMSDKAAKYYLIYGSFTNKGDAEEALKRYKNAGFSKASIVVKERKYRVALDVCTNLKDAMKSKEKYKDLYPEAWIHKE